MLLIAWHKRQEVSMKLTQLHSSVRMPSKVADNHRMARLTSLKTCVEKYMTALMPANC